MQFEIEIEKNDKGEWVATAVGYDVSVIGRSEPEALSRIMDALSAHFKKSPPQKSR